MVLFVTRRFWRNKNQRLEDIFMAKQILESIFQKSLNQYKHKWYFEKLQVNRFAHCKTSADYNVFTPQYRYKVECKETDIRKENKSFPFSRLTQKDELIYFENHQINNFSRVLLSFRRKFIRDSEFFLVPIKIFVDLERSINKKSVNLIDLNNKVSQYKVKVLKGLLQLCYTRFII